MFTKVNNLFDEFSEGIDKISDKINSMNNIIGLLGIDNPELNEKLRNAEWETSFAGV